MVERRTRTHSPGAYCEQGVVKAPAPAWLIEGALGTGAAKVSAPVVVLATADPVGELAAWARRDVEGTARTRCRWPAHGVASLRRGFPEGWVERA